MVKFVMKATNKNNFNSSLGAHSRRRPTKVVVENAKACVTLA